MRVGLEYAADKLATYPDGKSIGPERLSGIAASAKACDITWASLEALPGLARPVYNWRTLEALLESWSAAGVPIDCLVLRCQHPLATRATYPSRGGLLSSAPPKSPAMWSAYGRMCMSLAAYLLASGRHVAIQIESEADQLFSGTVDDYLRLLATAYDEIAAVSPRALVVLAGINVAGLLADDPTDDVIGERIMGLPEPLRSSATRSLDFYQRTLVEGRYHAAGFHSLHQVSAIAPTVRRMRALMPARREVWADDAFPAASLNFDSYRFNAPASRKEMETRLDALDRGDSASLADLYAEQVETTHARLIEMSEAGVERVYLGPLRDWPRATGQPWQGILNADGTPRPVCDVVRAAQS